MDSVKLTSDESANLKMVTNKPFFTESVVMFQYHTYLHLLLVWRISVCNLTDKTLGEEEGDLHGVNWTCASGRQHDHLCGLKKNTVEEKE